VPPSLPLLSSTNLRRGSSFLRSAASATTLSELQAHSIEVNDQIAAAYGSLSDRHFIISINRRSSDFSDEDFQLVEFISRGMDRIARTLERKLLIEKRVAHITETLESRTGISGWQDLTPKEIETLAPLVSESSITDIAHSEGISRHTLSERLGSIRAKLDLESTRQLRAVLREMAGVSLPLRKST
jgi:DNA-binding CsgD family transcriptional regulator